VRLAPGAAYVHYALAYALDDVGRPDEASAALHEALRLDPGRPDYHALLAYLEARRRCYPESLAAAEAGLRLAPEHAPCLNRRALALAALHRPEEAEAVSRCALALAPDDAATRAHVGGVLLQQDKPAPALEHLSQALRLDPEMDWARDRAVDALVLLVEQGLPGQALEHFPEGVGRDPTLEVGRQRLVRALTGRLPETLGGALQALWLLGCYLTVGPNPSPRLGLLLFLLLILYVCVAPRRFVLIEPVCHLLLLATRLGRRVLSRAQRGAALRVGGCLLAALLFGAAAGLTGEPTALLAAVVCQALVLPTAYLGASPPGRTRSGMAAYLALLSLGGAALLLLRAAGLLSPETADEGRDLLFLLGAGVTGLLGRALRALNREEAQPRLT
jgi:tetratricopeptide (TPR) repeat protein